MIPRLALASGTLVVVALLLTALVPGMATAHANYVSSVPYPGQIFSFAAAPTIVNVTLSEAVEAGTGSIRVTNTTGARFDIPPVALSADGRTMSQRLNATGAGIFTVAWTAVSAVDGHFTAGSFSYGVENPNGTLPGPVPSRIPISTGAPVSPLEVGLRFLGLLGLAAALGGSFLGALMWIPAGRDPDVSEKPGYRLGFQVLANVARVGAFAFALGLAGLFLLTDVLEGIPGSGSLIGSAYKLSVVASLGVGVVLFLVLSAAFSRSRTETPDRSRRELFAGVVLGFAAIGIGSAGTHAAASETLPAIATFADAAHIAGVALWVGGLATILAVRSFLREPDAVPLARIVIGGFSRMAFYAVGMVLLGGLILAVLLVGTVSALFGSAYGWVVLAKVALFAPMVAFGAYNRYRLLPRAADGGEPMKAFRQLTWNVRNETLLGITVLVLAALLAALTPTTAVPPGSGLFERDAVVSGIHVHMVVNPPPTIPGNYVFEFFLYYASNESPYNGGRNGTMTFHLLNSTLAPETVPLDGPHGNHFFNNTTAMSKLGVWRLDAHFQRLNDFDIIATFYIDLNGVG
jgi:copper transport protein